MKKLFLNYRDSGVDIDAGNKFVNRIKSIAKKTYRQEILSEVGGFSSLCTIPSKYRKPILVSSTDGVGTKLRLAADLNRYNTIGIDLVAMCVNDLVTQGAEPFFFLDYYATGKLNIDIATSIISGIAEGCLKSGCALIGGETAEMPGIYHNKDYDLAGFCVGIVEESKIINGKKIIIDDALIALGSNAHSNGYSLIRKIINMSGCNPSSVELEGKKLIDHLLAPTPIYVKNILDLINNVDVHAIVHLTGGGFLENIPRVLPNNMKAIIMESSWEWPTIFSWLQKKGDISQYEMYRTFNCGVGMIIILPEKQSDKAIKIMKEKGENVWKIGNIGVSNSKESVIFI